MRATRIVLLLFALSFLGFALFYVPRLANPLWSDIEFTGWVAPIARRIANGERIYQDFTLPIPPASFALMAGIQKLLGRHVLVDELWLCALSQLGMALLGYMISRPFTTSRNAVLVCIASMPLLIATPKEIAYDQTAQLVAWSSLALLAHALTRESASQRVRWLRYGGFASALTIGFKSSTGLGALCGAVLALGAVGFAQYRFSRKLFDRNQRRQWFAFFQGALGGIASIFLLVLALRGSVTEFVRVVFMDGPELKGGSHQALFNLFSYAVLQPPVTLTLLAAATLGYLIARSVKQGASFQVKPAAPQPRLDQGIPATLFVVGVGGYTILVFAAGAWLLMWNARGIPGQLRLLAGLAPVGPVLGLFLLTVFLIVNLWTASEKAPLRAAFGGVALSAGVISLMHNLSDPKHRPFYDNNPIIPLSILCLLLLFDDARARLLKSFSFALMLLGLFSPKFQRYLDARHIAGDSGFWSGLQVSDNGLILLTMAERARDLAGPSGRVLVLPEDPMLEELIGRPRPALLGAIVFVDQYPSRVLQKDLESLCSNPPEVVVLHPRDPVGWNRVYRIWSSQSPAAELQTEFVKRVVEPLYHVDSTYPTWLFQGPSTLAVLAKNPGQESTERP